LKRCYDDDTAAAATDDDDDDNAMWLAAKSYVTVQSFRCRRRPFNIRSVD